MTEISYLKNIADLNEFSDDNDSSDDDDYYNYCDNDSSDEFDEIVIRDDWGSVEEEDESVNRNYCCDSYYVDGNYVGHLAM